MSYVNGSIIQRESLAGGAMNRRSVLDNTGGLDQSRTSASYVRNTFSNNLEGVSLGDDPMNQLLPNTRIDLHILKNVSV